MKFNVKYILFVLGLVVGTQVMANCTAICTAQNKAWTGGSYPDCECSE